MKKLRIYADTSVIGGCLDEEFKADSLKFMQAVRRDACVLLLSEVVIRELEGAPAELLDIVRSLPATSVESVEFTEEVIELRDAYLAAEILPPRWSDDAAHVAAATVARADAIVSWNFKHIVRLDKMKAYNQVNLRQGYGIMTIITPKEVNLDEREED